MTHITRVVAAVLALLRETRCSHAYVRWMYYRPVCEDCLTAAIAQAVAAEDVQPDIVASPEEHPL
jgi:hypothetical protein